MSYFIIIGFLVILVFIALLYYLVIGNNYTSQYIAEYSQYFIFVLVYGIALYENQKKAQEKTKSGYSSLLFLFLVFFAIILYIAIIREYDFPKGLLGEAIKYVLSCIFAPICGFIIVSLLCKNTKASEPLHAAGMLALTAIILFSLASLFSWSINMDNWNLFSKILFLPTIIVAGAFIINPFRTDTKIINENTKEKQDSVKEKFNSYYQLAEQGDANAQYNLGVCFENGKGVTKDVTQAINWYRKAAEQCNVDAECKLGQLFCYSAIKDNVEIVDWVRRAAEQGYAKAQCSMGIYCYYGHGVTKDRVQAVSWYHKAAEQGYMLAQYTLGNIYKNGNNEIKKDGNVALYWYEKAISDEKRNLPKKLKTSAKKSIKKLEAAGYSSSKANIL